MHIFLTPGIHDDLLYLPCILSLPQGFMITSCTCHAYYLYPGITPPVPAVHIVFAPGIHDNLLYLPCILSFSKVFLNNLLYLPCILSLPQGIHDNLLYLPCILSLPLRFMITSCPCHAYCLYPRDS